MILLSLDFETTGLDTANDRVIEFGAVLYSTGQHKCLDNQGMLVQTDKIITQEITDITGITKSAVDKFGYDADCVFDTIMDMMNQADAVIGYNVRRFDYAVLYNWAYRKQVPLPNKPWIDIYADLPWRVPVGKLSHTAADHGILNLFPHSALADCQTTLAIANKYDHNMLLERAQSPVVILRSHQAQINNDQVKKAPFKFRWSPSRKIWWRPVKQTDLDEFMNAVPFKVTIEKELTERELDN
jgi:DNA polymerase III epsilon subunit-like protein